MATSMTRLGTAVDTEHEFETYLGDGVDRTYCISFFIFFIPTVRSILNSSSLDVLLVLWAESTPNLH